MTLIVDADCYELGGTGCYAVYGFEYKAGYEADKGVCTFSPPSSESGAHRLMRCPFLSRSISPG